MNERANMNRQKLHEIKRFHGDNFVFSDIIFSKHPELMNLIIDSETTKKMITYGIFSSLYFIRSANKYIFPLSYEVVSNPIISNIGNEEIIYTQPNTPYCILSCIDALFFKKIFITVEDAELYINLLSKLYTDDEDFRKGIFSLRVKYDILEQSLNKGTKA